MRADRASADKMLLQIYEKYKGRVEVYCIDPRSIFWFFDLVRFRVKATDIVWILNGKLLFRGVPEWAVIDAILVDALDAEARVPLKK